MRDVAKEALLVRHKALQACRHSVDLPAKIAQFVASLARNLDVKSPFGNLLGDSIHLANGMRQPSHKRQPAEQRNAHKGYGDSDPQAPIEKQAAVEER